MGFDDLGRHLHEIGDLTEAAKAFTKEREHCQTSAHVSIMNFRLVHVYIDQEAWMSVETTVGKLRSLHKPSDSPKPPPSAAPAISDADKVSAKLSAAQGLAHMAQRNYRAAALSFLECHPCMLQARPDEPADDLSYNEVLTPNDIATYGALCALAALDRAELQSRVLSSASFRAYLELEPHLRRAVAAFVATRFADCLAALAAHRADYLCDVYLSRHYADLAARVRAKALVLYFSPFARVTLAELARAFHAESPDALVPELARLIERGALPARLDLEAGVLLKQRKDPRRQVYADALRAAEDYEATLHQRLWRMAVINAGLEVKPPKPEKGGGGGGLMRGDTLMGLDGAGLRAKQSRGAYYF